MTHCKTKVIFLVGHRQQHGKDTFCSCVENVCKSENISIKRTLFANLLKKQVAERYNLDSELIYGSDEYKKWCPPWIKPKETYIDVVTNLSVSKEFAIQSGREYKVVSTPVTVRQLLIDEGCTARTIWEDVWASYAFKEIIDSQAQIGIISDFRYPNEYFKVDEIFKNILSGKPPKIVKVIVHRPKGKIVKDGADDMLPDTPAYWDEFIINEEVPSWEHNLLMAARELIMENQKWLVE